MFDPFRMLSNVRLAAIFLARVLYRAALRRTPIARKLARTAESLGLISARDSRMSPTTGLCGTCREGSRLRGCSRGRGQ
jgi:hypothetical protein